MATGGPVPAGPASGGRELQPDPAGDRGQQGDSGAPVAHDAQGTIDDGPVNVCNGQPWVSHFGDQDATPCPECMRAAAEIWAGVRS